MILALPLADAVKRSALVVPSGAVNAAVEPVVTAIFEGVQVVKKFSLCNAKFVPEGSTKSAGHPVTPPLV
jgi:hypothetical protein